MKSNYPELALEEIVFPNEVIKEHPRIMLIISIKDCCINVGGGVGKILINIVLMNVVLESVKDRSTGKKSSRYRRFKRLVKKLPIGKQKNCYC